MICARRPGRFYASVRLDVRRIDSIKQGQDVVGGRHRVKVVKNKVAPPFRVAEFDLMFAEGISTAGNLLDVGVDLGIVRKSGAWFYLDEERIGQGRENAKEFIKSHPEMQQVLQNRIKGVTDTTAAVPVVAGASGAGEDDEEFEEGE